MFSIVQGIIMICEISTIKDSTNSDSWRDGPITQVHLVVWDDLAVVSIKVRKPLNYPENILV